MPRPINIVAGRTFTPQDARFVKSGGSVIVGAVTPSVLNSEQLVSSGDALAAPSLSNQRRAREKDKVPVAVAAAPNIVSTHWSLPGFSPAGSVSDLNFSRRGGRRPKRPDNVVLRLN